MSLNLSQNAPFRAVEESGRAGISHEIGEVQILELSGSFYIGQLVRVPVSSPASFTSY